jgi:hypothetical protein
MMRYCLGVLLLALGLTPSWADDILVVTRHDMSIEDVTIKRLENIFLKKTLLNAAGVRWIPVNLSADHPVRRAFAQQLFNKLPENMESYWNAQYYQGIMPPYVVDSEEAMLRFIDSTPGAIGYISPCHLDKRVQVILKLTLSAPLGKSCAPPPTK